MYAQYRKWRRENLRDEDGILVGADQTQEWLLPWWWEHYRQHNSVPVAFVDFGMTQEKKNWCRARGEFVPLFVADIFVAEKEEIDPAIHDNWETNFGKKFWPCRNTWFKKPLACLQSPFRRTVWIDLDCEIQRPIEKLFDAIEPLGLAMVKERIKSLYPIYNSGVTAFRHGLPLIEEWADQSFEKNHLFRGDQELLSHIIEEKKFILEALPTDYNWSRCYEENPYAFITHWHGEFGRSVIRNRMNEF